MKGLVRRVTLRLAWLAIVAIISLGAAGIGGAMAHQPGTSSRPELTYAADQAIEPGLVAARDELASITDDVRHLGELGRDALGSLVSNDSEALQATVDEGAQLALSIERRSEELRQDLESLPGIGPAAELNLSPEIRRRHAILLAALDATDGLAGAWARLAAGAVSATRVSVLLTDHDPVVGEAAAKGRIGKYAEALGDLTRADAMIAQARILRDNLAATVDVSTLTQWLDITADYDAALRHLYQTIIDTNGEVTDEVRKAFEAEQAAAARLPPDTRALVIILAEIGRGGLNQAVITIEEARGELEAALGQLDVTLEDGTPDDGNPAPEDGIGLPSP